MDGITMSLIQIKAVIREMDDILFMASIARDKDSLNNNLMLLEEEMKVLWRAIEQTKKENR